MHPRFAKHGFGQHIERAASSQGLRSQLPTQVTLSPIQPFPVMRPEYIVVRLPPGLRSQAVACQ